MSSDSKKPSIPPSFGEGPDITDVDPRNLRRDTDPSIPVQDGAVIDKTIEESRDALGFEESIDTEVDFDALEAVRELEVSLSQAQAEHPGREEQKGESYADILESEVEQLSAEVERLNTALGDKETALKGARDDIAKSRERIERDSKKQLELKTRKLLFEFLEVLDDLDRALSSARELDHNPAVVDGVELVRKRFLIKLGEFGVSHAPAMGEVFDPNLHEAMAMVPATEPDKDGIIVGVIREGYTIGDEPLRPAGVAVAKRQG